MTTLWAEIIIALLALIGTLGGAYLAIKVVTPAMTSVRTFVPRFSSSKNLFIILSLFCW